MKYLLPVHCTEKNRRKTVSVSITSTTKWGEAPSCWSSWTLSSSPIRSVSLYNKRYTGFTVCVILSWYIRNAILQAWGHCFFAWLHYNREIIQNVWIIVNPFIYSLISIVGQGHLHWVFGSVEYYEDGFCNGSVWSSKQRNSYFSRFCCSYTVNRFQFCGIKGYVITCQYNGPTLAWKDRGSS